MNVKEGGANSKPELRNTGSESSKPSGQEGAAAQPGAKAEVRYESLQGYTFLVPDNWEAQPAEYGLYVTNREHSNGGLFFRVLYDKDYDPERMPSEEFERLLGKSVEKMVEEQIGVNEVRLVESKTVTVNGLRTTISHYSYKNNIQNGDVIEGFFYKDGYVFWINGLFPSPLYSQLDLDIRIIMESVRRE